MITFETFLYNETRKNHIKGAIYMRVLGGYEDTMVATPAHYYYSAKGFHY